MPAGSNPARPCQPATGDRSGLFPALVGLRCLLRTRSLAWEAGLAAKALLTPLR